MINRPMPVMQLFCAALLLAAGSGCGSQSGAAPRMEAKVHGQVTLNGQPIGPLTVHLMSFKHGNIAESPVDKEGKFQLDKEVPTDLYSFYLTGPQTGSPPTGIPAIYFSDTGTDQRFELKAGENEIKMELKK